MVKKLSIDARDATPKQLLVAIYQSMIRMEERMSALTDSVEALQSAIDGVAARLLPQLQALQAEKDALSAEAQGAVDSIQSGIDELNALGTDPSTPVDPGNAGNEAPAVETQADPETSV